MLIKKLSIRAKLAGLILVPLLVVIFYVGKSIQASWSIESKIERIELLIPILEANGELIHQLQKERGLTAIYLGSSGMSIANQLNNHRPNTDDALEKRNSLLVTYKEKLDSRLLASIRDVDGHLGKLQQIRTKVDAREIEGSEAVKYYSETNSLLLELISMIGNISEHPRVAHPVRSAFYLLQAKELAGIERAVMASALSEGRFTQDSYRAYEKVAVKESVYLGLFEESAPKGAEQMYLQLEQSRNSQEFVQIKETARRAGVDVPISLGPERWFNVATARIDGLKKIEEGLIKIIYDEAMHLTSEAHHNFWVSIILGGLALVISLWLSMFISKLIRSQVNSTVTVMSEVSNNQDLRSRARIHSEDELGQIAHSMNRLLDDFSMSLNRIKEHSHELASASEQSSVATTKSEDNMKILNEEMEQMATAIEQMTSTVQEVANSTSSAANAAEESSQIAGCATGSVNEAVDSIQGLKREITLLGSSIKNIQSKGTKIVSVIDVIKNVAEQTNLLALNAAIEAARAGEMGRGFAVVADEVRSLAQRTQQSTLEIEELINSFQQDTEGSVKLIDQCEKASEYSVEKIDAVKVSLDKMEVSVNTIKDMNYQIASACEQQATVTSQISVNINNANNRATETASAAQELATVSEQQARLAVKLSDMASIYQT